jgi:hypothetical protein
MRYCCILPLLAASAVAAQEFTPPPLPAVDPEIQRMVSEISAERIQKSIFILASFKTRHTLSDPEPSGDGIGAAAGWIRTQFQRTKAAAAGRLTVKEDSFTQKPVAPRVPRPVKITNLVATLNGTRAGSRHRVYLVSAHYDSRVKDALDATSAAPGADDDASGVAAVLELERVMSQYEFPSTLVFVAFAGEEQGVLGAAHWAAGAKARAMDIQGVLNNDIIGNTRGLKGAIERNRVRVFSEGVPPPAQWSDEIAEMVRTGGQNDFPGRQLARAVIDAAKVYVPSMKVQIVSRIDRYLRSGDQQPFLERGFPAVRFTEPTEDFTHEHEDVRTVNGVSYGDVPEAVDFVYVGDVARVNAATLAQLARAPETPHGFQIETARLQNDTTLRWNANPEPDLAGYRLVWRDSTTPTWQHHQDFPAAQTRVTVPVSKDDVVFGLQAFDSSGHVSAAVYPQPRKTL